MKKLLTILISSFSILHCVSAQDRISSEHESELADGYSDRIALARENLDYTAAVRPEASRELMIAQDRNARNRLYKPQDTRFTEGRLAQVVSAESDKPETSIEKTRLLIWQNAYIESPALLELKTSAGRNTYVWYILQDAANAKTNMELESAVDALKTLAK